LRVVGGNEMKCDELKPLVFSISDLAYVDERAVERNFENPHDHAVYKATEVDAAIAELKAKLESVQASAYADSVDAGMRERRLRRALWLSRAERAHLKVLEYWPDYCHNAHCRIAEQKWDKVERKCLKKAEEWG
jgi:hypothetical protein